MHLRQVVLEPELVGDDLAHRCAAIRVRDFSYGNVLPDSTLVIGLCEMPDEADLSSVSIFKKIVNRA